MYYFLFYDQDVYVGESYGTDPNDAVKRFCQRLGYGPELADGLTVLCNVQYSDFERIPAEWNVALC